MRCQNCGYDNPTEARFCANCGLKIETTAEQPAPAEPPGITPAIPEVAGEYAGFWLRLAAAIIDGIILLILSFILRFVILGFWFFWFPVFFVVPLLYYWLFTGLRGQTLGKMAVGVKVVDDRGSVPGLGIAALREIPGKIVSTPVIFLGFLWIIWDERKQGWHDKIAKTCVIRIKSRQ